MQEVYKTDERYEGSDYVQAPLTKGEYNSCEFVECNFAKADISNCVFIECSFEGCDLSMVSVMDTSFQKSSFTNCKMLGIALQDCSEFLLSFSFKECILEFCTFDGLSIPGTIFDDCQIRECDFSGCLLTGSHFRKCSLSRSQFDNTDLSNVDLSTSTDYIIHPMMNKTKGLMVSAEGAADILDIWKIAIK